MSPLLAILAAPIPAGAKALAALVDAKGGELTMLYAEIDLELGGSGHPKATQRKLKPLVAGGWASVSKNAAIGLVTIRLHWTDSDQSAGRSASTRRAENRPVVTGGEGGGCSNSSSTSTNSADVSVDAAPANNRGPELPPEQASEGAQLALVASPPPSEPARTKARRRAPKAWPPSTDAERVFLAHCVACLNAARLRAGWRAKRFKATSQAQCTRPLAWYRERGQGERRHSVTLDADQMICAVVWAHRRVPACDGTQTDLVRVWKGDEAGKLKVIQWVEEWLERGKPDPEVRQDSPVKASGCVHIEDDEEGKW